MVVKVLVAGVSVSHVVVLWPIGFGAATTNTDNAGATATWLTRRST
ncbi:MAG: hypothetical protein KDC08_03940 [Actinobacteria bacterium]|nr:hypothetical protein [Actinomycetota bacterium]